MTSTDMPSTEGKPVCFPLLPRRKYQHMGQQRSVGQAVFFCFLIPILQQYCIYLLFLPNIQYFTLIMIEMDYCELAWEPKTIIYNKVSMGNTYPNKHFHLSPN
jgi:hypothetical protein